MGAIAINRPSLPAKTATRTVLITSTRAPAALDLARLFAAAGWHVVGADCCRWPLGKFSIAFAAHARVPSPRHDHRAFAAAIARLIERERVDLLVPTCEEVFYLAHYHAELSKLCRLACPPFDVLAALHDKSRLPEMAVGLGIAIPETHLLQDASNIVERCRRVSDKVVLKPAFSRFANRTLICPDEAAIAALRPSSAEPWVCQRYIEGDEYCTYAVAQQGKLTAFAAYRPMHRVGKGSGVLFAPVNSPELERFAASFAARHALDGQFAFDLIDSPEGSWHVLECNPRATSGVHLFNPEDNLPSAFFDKPPDVIRPSDPAPKMAALAMLLFGLPQALASRRLPTALANWKAAHDVIGRNGDYGPSLGQFAALAENLAKAAHLGCSPLAASTNDIEWNGEALA